MALLDKIQQTPDFFFIQIGGNDGKRGDPIYPYIIRYGWKGIIVEPTQYWFQKLSQTYHHHSHIRLENAAIAEIDGEKTLYQVEPRNWYLRFIGGSLSSFSLNTLLKHKWRPGLKNNIVTNAVPCLSFKTLFAKYHVTKIDLLVMDTEGYDYTLLQHFDFSYIRPIMILYEHKHMSEKEEKTCRLLLEENGYRLEKQGRNTFAY
ncbi:FkbM family methyltransferase [Candidatus Peregrinibacteria bacterium]|nr:FkbM family methyltransferase [Candidatus Peregrinibacteria bacterium]